MPEPRSLDGKVTALRSAIDKCRDDIPALREKRDALQKKSHDAAIELERKMERLSYLYSQLQETYDEGGSP